MKNLEVNKKGSEKRGHSFAESWKISAFRMVFFWFCGSKPALKTQSRDLKSEPIDDYWRILDLNLVSERWLSQGFNLRKKKKVSFNFLWYHFHNSECHLSFLSRFTFVGHIYWENNLMGGACLLGFWHLRCCDEPFSYFMLVPRAADCKKTDKSWMFSSSVTIRWVYFFHVCSTKVKERPGRRSYARSVSQLLQIK